VVGRDVFSGGSRRITRAEGSKGLAPSRQVFENSVVERWVGVSRDERKQARERRILRDQDLVAIEGAVEEPFWRTCIRHFGVRGRVERFVRKRDEGTQFFIESNSKFTTIITFLFPGSFLSQFYTVYYKID
jgi:hypothetical protein